MKKLFFLTTILAAACFGQSAKAQVNVRINIGTQPIWGPVGYDEAEYYYLPDLDAYYDVTNRQYYFYQEGRWMGMRELPGRYRDFDMYHAHKVVINESQPWMHNDRYRTQYAGYRGRNDQQVIRDSRDERYWENPNHPQHGNWHGNNGNHGGNDHGHDNDGGQRNDHGRGEGGEQRNDHVHDEGHGGRDK
jgi:hypothetical protein